MTDTGSAADAAAARRDALGERLFQATVGTWDVLTVYVGDRLGLYRILADRGPMTSAELADAAGLSERYVREWLEQQATSAILEVDDARVPDTFDPPGDDLERFYYGFSIFHCLPVGMIGADAAGTGTVMRAGTVRRYADEAGFGGFEVLPIENDFYRFYRLVP